MKKTLLILSLAASLVSTSAMAVLPTPYKTTEAAVPASVTQWLKANNAHVVFHTLEKAQAFAKKNGINPDKIQTYVISSKHSPKAEGKKIYLIDNIGIGKPGKPGSQR